MVWSELGAGILHVLSSPFRDLSVLWQLVPILMMWILLEVYFVRWHEKLGWNSGLANAITLFWVSVTSMQIIFATLFSWSKFTVFLIGILYAFLLAFVMFRHSVTERFAFLMASPILIHYMALVFVLWAHSLIQMSFFVFVAIIVLFLVFIVLDVALKFLIKEEGIVEKSFRSSFQQEKNPQNELNNF